MFSPDIFVQQSFSRHCVYTLYFTFNLNKIILFYFIWDTKALMSEISKLCNIGILFYILLTFLSIVSVHWLFFITVFLLNCEQKIHFLLICVCIKVKLCSWWKSIKPSKAFRKHYFACVRLFTFILFNALIYIV